MEQLELQLDSFDAPERHDALVALVEHWRVGGIELPEAGSHVNLHIHSFYSHNAYGYSPSKAAWLAKKHGLAVAGIMDFDTLEGAEEFFDAAAMLDVKACVGMETRVFVPEFAERVGEELRPGRESLLDGIGPDASPDSILSRIRAG